MTIQRLHVGPRMSEVAIHNGLVWLAGQVAADPVPDVREQTKQVLEAIDRLLAEADSDKTRILQATIFLANIADFPAMNEVWDTWVSPGNTPPRATLEARLASPNYRVEIKIVAAQR